MNKKIAIYTALFGNYDILEDPTFIDDECDYICFTDQNIKSRVWKIIHTNPALNPSLENRKYKILAHKYLYDYEYSLYIDANLLIKFSPSKFIKNYLDNHLLCIPKHIIHNCTYKEAFRGLTSNRIDGFKVFKQMLTYNYLGFPMNYGLTENSIILRRHMDPNVMNFMEKWWSELNKYALRDQVSLHFLIWKENFPINMINENCRPPYTYFGFKRHTKNKKNYLYFKLYRAIICKLPLMSIIYLSHFIRFLKGVKVS
tara:strand:- start:353 stop:1123 length:771 start_codon:yes stop_codon:yes gene_type:complete